VTRTLEADGINSFPSLSSRLSQLLCYAVKRQNDGHSSSRCLGDVYSTRVRMQPPITNFGVRRSYIFFGRSRHNKWYCFDQVFCFKLPTPDITTTQADNDTRDTPATGLEPIFRQLFTSFQTEVCNRLDTLEHAVKESSARIASLEEAMRLLTNP
jgi:hypothetical protein